MFVAPIVAACRGSGRSRRTSSELLIDVSRRRCRARHGGVAGFVDWKRQAEAMVWLLAEEDGAVVGAGYALTGWHTPPHRAIGAALVVPEHRGRGTGDEIRAALERWAGGARRDRARRAGRRGRRGQRRLGGRPRLRGDRSQLAHGARPDRDRGARGDARRRESRSSPGPSGPSSPKGSGRSHARPAPTSRARRRPTPAPSRSGSSATCAVPATGPRRCSSRSRTARCSATPSSPSRQERTDRAFHDLTGVKRAHRGRGIAAALKATQIAWAKEHGYTSLQTANEVRNAPIRHLNAKHGYVLEPGNVIVRRAIG